MSVGYVRALGLLHRSFSGYSAGQRVHILIRFLTAPFLRTLEDLPLGGRVLEIGSGHGVFARLAAEERASVVVAVDPDLRKSMLPSPSLKVRKVAGYDDCIRGTFDAVALYDVAYRLPPEVRRALFERIFARLRPGGVFLMKEMDSGRRWKMKWTRFQERLSDRFLGITLGEGFVDQPREEVEEMLRAIGFTSFRARPVDRGYPHPHILYTAVKP
jgi:cyclopropane fatty-acyl-phospholipid synthase-like methyltransferase